MTATRFRAATGAGARAGYTKLYHVAKTGSDANPGTANLPFLTIGAAVTAAMTDNAAGHTVRILIKTGTYREQVTLGSGGTTAKMLLNGIEAGVVVSGADATTSGDWTAHDAPNRIYHTPWTNNWGVQAWPGGWPTDLGTDVLRRREVVIVDGVWVRQVLTLAEIDDFDSAYFVDEAADRLYLRYPTGETPSTALVELGKRERCLQATSRSNLAVKGITFQHATPLMQAAGVEFTSCPGLLVEDVATKGHSWTGWAAGQATGMTLRRVKSDDNGVLGFASFRGQQLTCEDGTATGNGQTRANWAGMDQWENGAGKMFETRNTTMRRYTCNGNYGPGPWWDTDNKDLLLEDVTAANNTDHGLFIEANQGPVTIRRGKITGNGQSGVQNNHSKNFVLEDAEIWDNKVEVAFGSWNTPVSITEWDTSTPHNLDTPQACTVQDCLIWGSVTGTDRYLVVVPHLFTNHAETWRTTYTAANNAYYSSGTGFPSTTPFIGRNSDNSSSFKNFTDWKSYLAGSRDSTSTLSTSAPSPPPSL